MKTREEEMKIMDEKIKKLENKYKEAVEERNSQMSKIFGASMNRSQSRGGMSRLQEMRSKIQSNNLERSKMKSKIQ